MSTYIYLVCEDHNPPIRAVDESGQHLDAQNALAGARLALAEVAG